MKIELNNGREVVFNLSIIDSAFSRIIYIGNEYCRHDHPILPAEIHSNGYMCWNKSNILHRVGKPARIWQNWLKQYWEDGLFIKSES